jgi:hypothetical protein
MIVIHPVCAGISGYFFVEDRQASFQFGGMGANPVAMVGQKLLALRIGRRPFGPQLRIAHHLADRHSGRFQTAKKCDPDQDGGVIIPVPGSVSRRTWQQPDSFVVADRVRAEAAAFREISDFHALSCLVTTPKVIRVGARSKSRIDLNGALSRHA